VLHEVEETQPPIVFDAKVLDGAAIVHLLPTTGINTFNDYASSVFIPYIKKQLESSVRIDVVWDTYILPRIKESTREKRSKGKQRKVAGKKLPSN